MSQLANGVTKEQIKAAPPGAKGVHKGNNVTVHCTGFVKATGKKFWSTKDPGQSVFSFKVDMGQVIKGWDVGCLSMKVGEAARFTLSPEMGYGPSGFPAWGIPPNAELIFEIEMVSVS